MPANLEASVKLRKGISVACVRVQTLFVCTQDELIHSGQDFAQRVNDLNVVELERLRMEQRTSRAGRLRRKNNKNN